MSERALPRPSEHPARPRVAPRDLPVGREAVTLPILLLTIAAIGGFRVDGAGKIALVPPSLMALVLGVLLIGTLVRSGALAPDRLVSERRSALENTSGAMVLVALLLAASQMFTLLKELIPGAETWPRFVRNRSEQFEARLCSVRIEPSPSILTSSLASLSDVTVWVKPSSLLIVGGSSAVASAT